MSFPWTLDYWKSGECQVLLERLDDLKGDYAPSRRDLWRALSMIPLDQVRVCIVGQDPYPNPKLATGLAFSIPPEIKSFPPTLQNIFKEYQDDLGYPAPTSGDLTPWVRQGVLLWNAIPVCPQGRSLGAYDWPEWRFLTEEIISKLGQRNVPLCYLGGVAREFAKPSEIQTAHPSPRASLNAKEPFNGSKIFSRINAALEKPIEWRL